LGLALAGCETMAVAGLKPSGEPATAAAVVVPGQGAVATRSPDDPDDDVTLGKEHFRAENYGLAELHFRRAAEARSGDVEAWMGLAASYDKLRRFDLADRAYAQAFKIAGPTPELLNNRGYSYLLRGDVNRASRDLAQASLQNPADERIRNNLRALDERVRRR
jgi:Flp pilus assembly protein TadD